jgi:heptaprenylglyceryl phosphate synthase
LAVEAGADVVVVGNALEKNLGLIPEIAKIIHAFTPT